MDPTSYNLDRPSAPWKTACRARHGAEGQGDGVRTACPVLELTRNIVNASVWLTLGTPESQQSATTPKSEKSSEDSAAEQKRHEPVRVSGMTSSDTSSAPAAPSSANVDSTVSLTQTNRRRAEEAPALGSAVKMPAKTGTPAPSQSTGCESQLRAPSQLQVNAHRGRQR